MLATLVTAIAVGLLAGVAVVGAVAVAVCIHRTLERSVAMIIGDSP
jgi:hypothetical protein